MAILPRKKNNMHALHQLYTPICHANQLLKKIRTLTSFRRVNPDVRYDYIINIIIIQNLLMSHNNFGFVSSDSAITSLCNLLELSPGKFPITGKALCSTAPLITET